MTSNGQLYAPLRGLDGGRAAIGSSLIGFNSKKACLFGVLDEIRYTWALLEESILFKLVFRSRFSALFLLGRT
jgi:hypothetical protein